MAAKHGNCCYFWRFDQLTMCGGTDLKIGKWQTIRECDADLQSIYKTYAGGTLIDCYTGHTIVRL